MGLAEQLYSSKQSAQSAVQKLEVLGFVENSAPGYFKVVKVTNDVRQFLKTDDSSNANGSESTEKAESGNGYSMEKVETA